MEYTPRPLPNGMKNFFLLILILGVASAAFLLYGSINSLMNTSGNGIALAGFTLYLSVGLLLFAGFWVSVFYTAWRQIGISLNGSTIRFFAQTDFAKYHLPSPKPAWRSWRLDLFDRVSQKEQLVDQGGNKSISLIAFESQFVDLKISNQDLINADGEHYYQDIQRRVDGHSSEADDVILKDGDLRSSELYESNSSYQRYTLIGVLWWVYFTIPLILFIPFFASRSILGLVVLVICVILGAFTLLGKWLLFQSSLGVRVRVTQKKLSFSVNELPFGARRFVPAYQFPKDEVDLSKLRKVIYDNTGVAKLTSHRFLLSWTPCIVERFILVLDDESEVSFYNVFDNGGELFECLMAIAQRNRALS